MIAFIALLTFKTRHNIRDGVVHGVTDVNPMAAWVIKHAHGDIFVFATVEVGFIDLGFIPDSLPFRLDFFRVVSSHRPLV